MAYLCFILVVIYIKWNLSETWRELLRPFHTDVPSCSLWKQTENPLRDSLPLSYYAAKESVWTQG